jgi:hypothetical protein
MNARMRVLLDPSKQLVRLNGWEVGIYHTGQLSPQPPRRLGSIDGHGGWTEPDRVGGERAKMPTISGEAGGLVAGGGRGGRADHGRQRLEDRMDRRRIEEISGRIKRRAGSQQKAKKSSTGRTGRCHRDMTCRKILRPLRDKAWLGFLRGEPVELRIDSVSTWALWIGLTIVDWGGSTPRSLFPKGPFVKPNEGDPLGGRAVAWGSRSATLALQNYTYFFQK